MFQMNFSARVAAFLMLAVSAVAGPPEALRTGVAGHAFDHLSDIADQADAALASGDNIIYCGRVGELGYGGLPEEVKLTKAREDMLAYTTKAKQEGIRLAIGYVCATSIVKLDSFDRNWTAEFRAQFHAAPAEWRQQGRNGKPLPSWYGGDYQPACMNNPDWRMYEKNIVRMELESGCDGIFFDNPTVHPQGCYCPFCMEKFAGFLAGRTNLAGDGGKKPGIEELRQLAEQHSREFMEFRAVTARDFMSEIKSYARTLKRGALVTCNNSLNSPDALFAQTRADGYDIDEMSKTEDFVLVEDMVSQPRTQPGGRSWEYGPTYRQLHAISHGKPVVAVTVADADYHTPPELMRLAMAEAAAHDASYLAWPTWPEKERKRMAAAVRPEADFLRDNQKLLNGTTPRCDVALFLCFRRWLDTDRCAVSAIAATLTRENIQYAVHSEENFGELMKRQNGRLPVLLLESRSILDKDEKRAVTKFEKSGGRVVVADAGEWLAKLKSDIPEPSVVVEGPASVRVVVRDQGKRTIVHIYNLNVEKISSYEDKVHPAENIRLKVRTAAGRIHSIRMSSADAGGAAFSSEGEEGGKVAVISLPRLEIAAMAVIE
jgi:hypothetical protein